MAVAQGYGKTVTSGSVFAYDVADTRNSYIGEPTVNLAGTDAARTIEFHNQGAYGNAGSVSDAPEKGQGWKKITITNRGNNFRIAQFPYTSLPGSVTYTYSLEVDMGTTSGYYWRIDGSGGYSEITIVNNKVVTTITPSAGSYAIFLNHNTTGVSGISEVIYYRYYQVENKTKATQFTTGTRSATQGLLPLIGNSTIDLTNVSFDANAKMVFDGTNDYVNVPYNTSHNLTSQGTISAWINPATLTQGSFAGIVAQCTGGSVNTQAYTLSWRQISNAFLGQICNGSGTYNEIYASLPTVANVWYNIVFTWNGSQLVMYNNGVVIGTTTQTINCQVLSTDLTIGGFTYKGAGGSGEAFNGSISKVQLYNRGLTAHEVMQNYQQHKTRFNLS